MGVILPRLFLDVDLSISFDLYFFFLTEVLAKQLSTIMGIKKKREKEKERRKKRMRMKKKCDRKSIGESKIDRHK